jgi:hypothetical protein
MIEFNASTFLVTGGVNELNVVGYVNITKVISSPISVRLAKDLPYFNLSNLFSRTDVSEFAKM